MNIKEELRKNLKYIVILFVLLFVYVVLAVFFNTDSGDKSDGYLIVGKSLIYEKVDDEFKQLNDIPDLDGFTFRAYNGNSRIDDVSVQYADDFYFFDKDYNDEVFDDFRIAFTNNLNITINQNRVQRYDDGDENYINQVIETNNSEAIEAYKISLRKLLLDADGDNEEEILYTMSNYSYEVTDYKQVSYLFIVDNGDVKVLDTSDGFNPFVIIESLDINGDNFFEVVIAKNVMDVPSFDSCYQIYGVQDNKFSLIQDCGKNEE